MKNPFANVRTEEDWNKALDLQLSQAVLNNKKNNKKGVRLVEDGVNVDDMLRGLRQIGTPSDNDRDRQLERLKEMLRNQK